MSRILILTTPPLQNSTRPIKNPQLAPTRRSPGISGSGRRKRSRVDDVGPHAGAERRKGSLPTLDRKSARSTKSSACRRSSLAIIGG